MPLTRGRTCRGTATAPAGAAPHDVFPCMGDDEWVAIAVTDDAEWKALCGVIGEREIARIRALRRCGAR